MRLNEISGRIVNTCFKVHKTLGPGLLESVYESILEFELQKQGFQVERQKPIPVVWENVKLPVGFRLDLLVEGKVLIEVKSVEHLGPVHYKQVQTYLKLSDLTLGLLVDFNENLMKDGLSRIVNGFRDG